MVSDFGRYQRAHPIHEQRDMGDETPEPPVDGLTAEQRRRLDFESYIHHDEIRVQTRMEPEE